MTEEKKQKLTAARAKVDKANKWRLTFLFIAVLFLLFIFFGGKFFEQTPGSKPQNNGSTSSPAGT